MPTFTSSSACSLIAVGSGEQSESCSKDIWAYKELGFWHLEETRTMMRLQNPQIEKESVKSESVN